MHSSGTMEYDQTGGEVKRVIAGVAARSGIHRAVNVKEGPAPTPLSMTSSNASGIFKLLDDDLPAITSLAKACAAEAYVQTAIHAVQMHGGIGFTWDNDTHLWFKRAKSSEILFGDANQHRELMMQHWKH